MSRYSKDTNTLGDEDLDWFVRSVDLDELQLRLGDVNLDNFLQSIKEEDGHVAQLSPGPTEEISLSSLFLMMNLPAENRLCSHSRHTLQNKMVLLRL